MNKTLWITIVACACLMTMRYACESPNTSVSNNYPQCLTDSNRTYRLEYDYMNGYDATTEMYKITGAFDGAKVTIEKTYITPSPYVLFDCEGRRSKRDSLLWIYVNSNYQHNADTNIHGYLVGIDRVLNDVNVDIGGICLRDGYYNPAFTYTGKCREAYPAFGDIYAAGVTVHELMHQMVIQGHPSHSGANADCCIINGSYPNGFCQATNIIICDGHRCTINDFPWPRNP